MIDAPDTRDLWGDIGEHYVRCARKVISEQLWCRGIGDVCHEGFNVFIGEFCDSLEVDAQHEPLFANFLARNLKPPPRGSPKIDDDIAASDELIASV